MRRATRQRWCNASRILKFMSSMIQTSLQLFPETNQFQNNPPEDSHSSRVKPNQHK